MNDLFLKFISLGAIFLIIFSFVHIVLNNFRVSHPSKNFFSKYRLKLLFFVSTVAVVGSLLLSFYFKLVACELCWYQRIFLFPIPVITLIALIKKDYKAHVHVYWLSIIGLFFALYHSLLQSRLFVTDTVFCNPNNIIDCAIATFTYFGFVTIPVISFSVFILLICIAHESEKI